MRTNPRALRILLHRNGLTPKELHHIVKPNQEGTQTPSLPEFPQPGLGKLILKGICDEYNLNIEKVIEALKDENIQASQDMNFKKIAEQNQTSPMNVYDIIWSNLKGVHQDI